MLNTFLSSKTLICKRCNACLKGPNTCVTWLSDLFTGSLLAVSLPGYSGKVPLQSLVYIVFKTFQCSLDQCLFPLLYLKEMFWVFQKCIKLWLCFASLLRVNGTEEVLSVEWDLSAVEGQGPEDSDSGTAEVMSVWDVCCPKVGYISSVLISSQRL